jgi:succinoglycan biosynthesis protein ExoU
MIRCGIEEDMTRVSVIIAAKDAEATIGRAVRSALAEPETEEVLLVDDGSADGTIAAARAAAAGSDRLVLHALPRNRGPAAARNLALDTARAPLVAILDADDWLEPGRFARLLAAAGEGWDLAADDLLLAEEEWAEAPPRPLLGLAGPARDVGLAGFVESNLPDPRRPRQELGYLKPLMRRAFLDAHGLRYDPGVRLGEDYALYAAALARGGRFRLVPACGYVALQRRGSLSRRHGAAELLALARADEALLALPGLPPAAVVALRRHRRATLDKHFLRVALDAKAASDWAGVARAFLGTPSAAWHILSETLGARLRPSSSGA